MMGWESGMGGGAWVLMGIFWVALLALIIFLVVRLLPNAGRKGGESGPDSPQDILDRRFARGEIDAEAHQTQRSALMSARGRR